MSGMEWGPKRAFADPETTSMVAVAVVVLVATYPRCHVWGRRLTRGDSKVCNCLRLAERGPARAGH